MEVSQDGFFLICIGFSLKSIDQWRNLFYIVIAAMYNTIFSSRFCLYIKGRYLGTKLLSKFFFCLNRIIFLLQTDLKEISQLSKMVRKRGKTFIWLNWSQNEKGRLQFRKTHRFPLIWNVLLQLLSLQLCLLFFS